MAIVHALGTGDQEQALSDLQCNRPLGTDMCQDVPALCHLGNSSSAENHVAKLTLPQLSASGLDSHEIIHLCVSLNRIQSGLSLPSPFSRISAFVQSSVVLHHSEEDCSFRDDSLIWWINKIPCQC